VPRALAALAVASTTVLIEGVPVAVMVAQ